MTTSARSTVQDPVAVAARRAYEEADGDVRSAVAAMERAVRGERSLRDALTDPLISNACYVAITAQCRGARRRVWSAPVYPGRAKARRASDAFGVRQLARGTLLMFPLPGGKRLGDATRAEISTAADFYARQSSDMAVKARWLRLIAQSLPGDALVSDVLSDERLRELREIAHAG